MGDAALKVAPLVKHRNEMIHQYLKVNWQNIIVMRDRVKEIKEFAKRMKDVLEE